MLKKKQSRLNKSYIIKGYLFLLPATLVYLFFAIIPVFDSVILSFQKWNGFSSRSAAGFVNYTKAFHDSTFLVSMRNSIYIGGVSSFFSVITGVFLAWLLLYSHKRTGNLYRTIIFSPSMIPPIITALVFSFVYEPEIGILNNFLDLLHLDNFKRAWLTNKSTVLNCITFVSLWKQIGLTMVLCFAGMQSIPLSLIESAYIEGANDLSIFKKIILPLVKPFIQLSAVFALMNGLKIYDSVLALTDGGPGRFSYVMPMWIIKTTFAHNNYGYGAAMSIIFVFIVLAGMILVKKLIKGTSYEL